MPMYRNWVNVKRKEKRQLLKTGRYFLCLVVVLSYCVPSLAKRDSFHNGIILGVYTHSNNAYIGALGSLASALLDVPLAMATKGAATVDYNLPIYHQFGVLDNEEEVGFKKASGYKFKAYDVLNDIECGLKLGWLGKVSPVGAFLYGGYGYNQYKLRFLGEKDYTKHKLQSARIGVGLRLSPFVKLMEDVDWCPIAEISSTYIYNFNYKGPNGNDKNQINNGTRSSFGIGAQFNEVDLGGDSEYTGTIMLCFERANYDIFNRNYTPDGGFWYPYANCKSKDWSISLRLSINIFSED